MIFRTFVKLIQCGRIAGIEERIDYMFAIGKLTEAEYAELIAMLKGEQ